MLMDNLFCTVYKLLLQTSPPPVRSFVLAAPLVCNLIYHLYDFQLRRKTV